MDGYAKRRFGDLVDRTAARLPLREALVFQDRRYDWRAVAAEVDRTAKGLMALGVGPGTHVAVWLNNAAEWVFLSFALAKIGAVQVPINTRFRTRDFAYVLGQSDSSLLITHDRSGPIDYLEMVREVVALPAAGGEVADPNLPELKRVVILGSGRHDGTLPWSELLGAGETVSDGALAARAAAVDPDGPFLIMYTSGTTGFPKGAMHDHRLVRNTAERGFRMAITPNDTILNYLPLFHAFGFSEGMLMSALTGARQVVMETFDPERALELIEAERVTVTHGFEAHMQALTEAQVRRPRDMSSLRTGLFAAGMHSATPVCRRGLRVLAPLRSVSGYGMTEIWLGVGVGALDEDERHRTESSGYPGLGYELRIVDPETGREVAPGEPGELLVKGEYLMQGYYKKPEETAACYDAEGWFHTGDTATWLEDGYLRFLGRYKDMLKVGGENVDPMETEGLLLEHPEVRQVAVVGLPDAKLAEVPVAFVERVPGSGLEAEAVIAFCRGKLASFKVPRHVVFVADFPMTASGKIRKVDLRAEAKRLLLPAAGADAVSGP